MHASIMDWVPRVLTAGEVTGKRVVEAGAFNVNGSARHHVVSLGPASYTGTDMRDGPGVDVACLAEDLPATLGDGCADVVISTSMLEHAADWQAAIRGMVTILAPGGLLLLTTCSKGFPLHGYPEDYWRFSVEAMGQICKALGLDVERLEPDPEQPGVFALARKPAAGWSAPEEPALDAVAVDAP